MPRISSRTADDKSDKIRRVKTGCLTCRSRRKKCDEKKPHCTGCVRNHLSCTWPTLIEPAVPTKTSRQRRSLSGELLPSVKRKFSQHKRKATAPTYDNTARVPVTFQLICTVDVWPGNISLRLPNVSGVFSQPFSRVLLQHYLHRTVDCLSCLDKSVTPFITDIMPIALSNNLVMQAVLALSGLHYTDTVSDALERGGYCRKDGKTSVRWNLVALLLILFLDHLLEPFRTVTEYMDSLVQQNITHLHEHRITLITLTVNTPYTNELRALRLISYSRTTILAPLN